MQEHEGRHGEALAELGAARARVDELEQVLQAQGIERDDALVQLDRSRADIVRLDAELAAQAGQRDDAVARLAQARPRAHGSRRRSRPRSRNAPTTATTRSPGSTTRMPRSPGSKRARRRGRCARDGPRAPERRPDSAGRPRSRGCRARRRPRPSPPRASTRRSHRSVGSKPWSTTTPTNATPPQRRDRSAGTRRGARRTARRHAGHARRDGGARRGARARARTGRSRDPLGARPASRPSIIAQARADADELRRQAMHEAETIRRDALTTAEGIRQIAQEDARELRNRAADVAVDDTHRAELIAGLLERIAKLERGSRSNASGSSGRPTASSAASAPSTRAWRPTRSSSAPRRRRRASASRPSSTRSNSAAAPTSTPPTSAPGRRSRRPRCGPRPNATPREHRAAAERDAARHIAAAEQDAAERRESARREAAKERDDAQREAKKILDDAEKDAAQRRRPPKRTRRSSSGAAEREAAEIREKARKERQRARDELAVLLDRLAGRRRRRLTERRLGESGGDGLGPTEVLVPDRVDRARRRDQRRRRVRRHRRAAQHHAALVAGGGPPCARCTPGTTRRRSPRCAGRRATGAARDRGSRPAVPQYWHRCPSRAKTARRESGAVARNGTRTKCTSRITVGTGTFRRSERNSAPLRWTISAFSFSTRTTARRDDTTQSGSKLALSKSARATVITSRAAEISRLYRCAGPAARCGATRSPRHGRAAAPFEVAHDVGGPRLRVERRTRSRAGTARTRGPGTGRNGGRAHHRAATTRTSWRTAVDHRCGRAQHCRTTHWNQNDAPCVMPGSPRSVPTPSTVAWRRWPASPGEGGGSPWPMPPPTEVDNGASRAPP